MTRRRSSAPGRVSPDRRRSFLLLVALAIIVVVGCTPTPPRASSTPEGSPGASVAGVSATPSESPVAPSDSPTSSVEPTAEASSDPPATPEPTEAPSASAPIGSASSCAGNTDNKDFYAAVAEAVDWPVYCPILPSGWFVIDGHYRAAAGGQMQIFYRGPSDKRIGLLEGSFCDDGSDCLPSGTDLGGAAFGDLDGTMIQTDDGYAIVVDGGNGPSWVLEGSGTSEDELRGIGSELLRIS